MAAKRVLFAHELAVIGRAVEQVLTCHGFEVSWVQRADEARARLKAGGMDALVIDVALPDEPGFGLIEQARGAGVSAVFLVAAVYRKTSYKRRPSRLYGADDYVEIHHLGDHLPQRLRRHFGLTQAEPFVESENQTHELLAEIGDERLDLATAQRVADVLVSDLLLYNGDAFALEGQDGLAARMREEAPGLVPLFSRLRPEEAADAQRYLQASLDRLMSHTDQAQAPASSPPAP